MMKPQTVNPFGIALHDCGNCNCAKVDRRRQIRRGRILAAMIALALPLTQTASAIGGEQVLEIPQAAARPSVNQPRPHVPDLYDTTPTSSPAPDAAADDPTAYATEPASAGAHGSAPAPEPTAVAANTESYPPDPNVGSINDYQNQPGENGQAPSFSFGGGSPRPEPAGSMATNLIMGGILVGMVALEIASSHHSHHR